jgi:iron complex transport system permease protein
VNRLSYRQTYILLGTLLLVAFTVSAGIGALSFTPNQMLRFLGQMTGWVSMSDRDALDRNVFLHLRLPRVLLCGLTGAVLGVSGTLMQGLFRNPIVEPGLTGTSAGAALGAAIVFVFGGHMASVFSASSAAVSVSLAAFAGAFGATMLVYRIATIFGKSEVFTLLLAGIAINAVCNAGTGFLSYVARDPQARNIIFWNLGTFTTANWPGTTIVGCVFLICFLWARRYGKALNALMLGEDEAASLGADPTKLFFRLIVVNTMMVSVATATVGVIAFVGLVIPHMLRMMKSADYTFLLPSSALLGAVVMEVIDVVARLVVMPAELPISIITAVVGAPIFLVLLVRQRRSGSNNHYG